MSDFKFGDVVLAHGVRHVVLGVATFDFEVAGLLVSHDDADPDLEARAGRVILMSLETRTARPAWPIGFIDAFNEDVIKKEG